MATVDRDRHERRLGVAHGIAQGLLDDAADCRAHQFPQILAIRRRLSTLIAEIRPPPPPKGDQVFDRFAQAEFGEPDRPQPAQHLPDLPLHMADRLGDRLDMSPASAARPSPAAARRPRRRY